MDQFDQVSLIGSGAYGKVYRGRRLKDGKEVALKKVRTSRVYGVDATTIREIGILKQLKHPHIIRLLDVIRLQRGILMVFEHLDCDLKKFIAKHRDVIDQGRIKRVMFQLVKGVAYLHSNRVMHRDLKTPNVLINETNEQVKIADFGLARMFSLPCRPYTHEVVTLWYRAPELLLGMKTYTVAVDIWSLGCIFTELATGQPIFRGQSEIDQIMKIFELLGTPNEESWPGVEDLPFYIGKCPQWKPKSLKTVTRMTDARALDLLSKMLYYEPSKRISAAEALCHDYFLDVQTAADSTLRSTCITNRKQFKAHSAPPRRNHKLPCAK